MKILLCIALVIVWGSSNMRGAHGIFVPPDPSPGNTSLGLFSASARVQTVYGRDGFPPILSDSAFLISGLYFRADERALPSSGSAFLSGLDVRLSTTSRLPDGLSAVFSENIGPDETAVIGPGPLNVNWSQGSFVTHIPFDRPYLYNPAAGSLLLDIRNFNGVIFPSLDAHALVGDSVSSVSTGAGANSQTGGILTHGYATLFWVDIVPIPEPGTTTLLLLSLLACSWQVRHLHKSSSIHR
jgi:hypothetical protein